MQTVRKTLDGFLTAERKRIKLNTKSEIEFKTMGRHNVANRLRTRLYLSRFLRVHEVENEWFKNQSYTDRVYSLLYISIM